MLGEQTPEDIQAATRCDGDNDAQRSVRVPGGIGAGGGGEEPGGGEQGGTKQQVAAEGHGEKSRLKCKNFLSGGEKYQEKRFYFLLIVPAKGFHQTACGEDYSPPRRDKPLFRKPQSLAISPKLEMLYPVACSATSKGPNPWRKSISSKT
jgi:hypothetical protein